MASGTVDQDELAVRGHYHKLAKMLRSQVQTLDEASLICEAHAAYDANTGTDCVWNTIRTTLSPIGEEKLRKRLDALIKVKHSNIFHYYDYYIDNVDGMHEIIFITETINKRSAARFMKQNAVPSKVWKRWCRQLLAALDCLGSNGVAHGYLTPERLYLQTDGLAKLGDLCLGDLRKRVVGSVTGRSYVAPEFFEPETELTPALDVYSFGMMVLYFATNEVPYSECDSEEIQKKIEAGIPPEALQKLEAGTPLRDLVEICLKPASVRPTPQELQHHPFLFEVPSLKVFCAWYIIRNKIEERYGNHRLSADDKQFLNEVSSGVWGTPTNVIQSPALEFRIMSLDKPGAPFVYNHGDPNSITMLWTYEDGKYYRNVTFNYDKEKDTPQCIVDELVFGGLLSVDDKEKFLNKLNSYFVNLEIEEKKKKVDEVDA